MSIGFLKRFLKLVNIAAVLGILGAGYAFWSHHEEMKDRWEPPDFVPRTEKRAGVSSRIEAIGMQLGRYPKPQEDVAEIEEEKPTENIMSVLDQLGKIKSAVVLYEPYAPGMSPALIFEFNQPQGPGQSKIATIRLGEALLNKPHPKHRNLLPIPVAYKFVGCEPDPEHPGWTYFLFDMRCDGTDIQKARWKRETETDNPLIGDPTLPPGALIGEKPGTFYFGPAIPSDEADKPAPAPEAGTAKAGTEPGEKPETKPVEPAEVLPGQINIGELSGPIFEEEGGTFNPTREGIDYLRDNYQKVLKDAETRTYRDPKTKRAAGIRVVRIKARSMANEFGIYPDDIIVSINDKPVTRQSQAINVVKAELKKASVKILRVKILRRGRTIEKRYDTRDPDLRAKARRSGFGRRG